MNKKVVVIGFIGIFIMGSFIVMPEVGSLKIVNECARSNDLSKGNQGCTIIVKLEGNTKGMSGAIATLDWFNGGGLHQEIKKEGGCFKTTFSDLGTGRHCVNITLAVSGYKVSPEEKLVYFDGMSGLKFATFWVTKSRCN